MSSEPMYWQRAKKRVSESLFKIQHWHIQLGDYRDAPDKEATWFIDPPYQHGGHKYRFGTRQLDFDQLRKWILTRQGQTIVCENAKADWMQFNPLVKNQGAQNNNTQECIWTNQPRPVQTSFSFA
jgi:16S rRNA G966 N2-methylase RsmD